MNISKAARQALIPIEREIMSKPVEHAYQLSKSGGILAENLGEKSQCHLKDIDTYVYTHNHPSGCIKFSSADILMAIKYKCREVRVIVNKGLCGLVEIPKFALNNEKLLEFLNNHNLLEEFVIIENLNRYSRKRDKELKKIGGLKFRTIKLPE